MCSWFYFLFERHRIAWVFKERGIRNEPSVHEPALEA
jgi:hypothetical protein